MATNRPEVTLYHECSAEAANKIRSEGIHSNATRLADEIDRSGGRYHLPADTSVSGEEYALQLVHRLIDERRPSHFPRHTGSTFFFGTTDHTMDRRCRVEVAVSLDEYEIVAAPWDVACDLFVDVMGEFRIGGSCDAATLDERIERYWSGAFVVTDPKQVGAGHEYYLPDSVPSTCIRDVSIVAGC